MTTTKIRINTNRAPRVGQTLTMHGQTYRITCVRPLGTIDVSSLDGKHHFRLSGLPFTSPKATP